MLYIRSPELIHLTTRTVFLFLKRLKGVAIVAQWVKNPTSINEDVGLVAGIIQWVKDMALPWNVV